MEIDGEVELREISGKFLLEVKKLKGFGGEKEKGVLGRLNV